MSPRVLIVEDDRLFSAAVAAFLDADFDVELQSDLRGARAALAERGFDVVLLDNQLPDGLGLDLARELAELEVEGAAPVLVMTASPRVPDTLLALRSGVVDFLVKPVSPVEIRHAIERAMRSSSLSREVWATRRRATPGASPHLEGIAQEIARAERRSTHHPPVLLEGPTGTGKSWLARRIHVTSSREHGPFVAINCAAVPPTLLEGELFGTEAGAFTGARAKMGLFEAASGGTLFLDELGELPRELQPKLLTALDDGEVRRLGGTRPRRFDCRLITATNRDLKREVQEGRFREDLLFRLDVLRYRIKPLAERREEIPALIESILSELGARRDLAPAEVERLAAYDWPGNTRELRNVLERALLLGEIDRPLRPSDALPKSQTRTLVGTSDGDTRVDRVASTANVPHEPGSAGTAGETFPTLETVEREHCLKVLDACGNRIEVASRTLDIAASTLRRKLAKWGRTPPE